MPARKGPRPTMEQLRAFVRQRGSGFLKDPNINSVGIGHKITGGKRTDQVCVQFTVDRKVEEARLKLEAAGSAMIPERIEFEDVAIPTDVIERRFSPSYRVVEIEEKPARKRRADPMRPGISVSHPDGTAGTLGAIVHDRQSGEACMLSNWHVLSTPTGKLGDDIVQPGPYDDDRVQENRAGVLVRRHLGLAGDCAIARIEGRGFDECILDLDVAIREIGKPELGDRVVKSGRTTAVTRGIVRRIETITKIDYEGATGQKEIGGFEIGPDPDFPPESNEISMGGDSGSAWLAADEEGRPTGTMVGLHFAGEGGGDPDEHAMACYAHSVFEKLEIDLAAPAGVDDMPGPNGAAGPGGAEAAPGGYVVEFLGVPVRAPDVLVAGDVYHFHGSALIPYTHFSVCLSRSRRMARYVAWNIDGDRLKKYGRKGLDFDFDPRIDEGLQVGNDAYAGNKLDRGHIARRADLVWGPKAEAMRANRDSFFYTNITPQHQAFNQSERAGLWGLLENAIYDDVDVENLKVSVLGGPIFKQSDMEYRGIRIPASFWKAIFYREGGHLRAKAYILTQDDLLDDIEALELDQFRLYQVTLEEIEQRAKLRFEAPLKDADTFVPEAIGLEAAGGRRRQAREILTRGDLVR